MAQFAPFQRNNPMLIPESPMQFLPSLGALVGEKEALFLQQLQYWLAHSKHIIKGEKWVYNTLDEWNLQFYWWSKMTLRRVISKLKDFPYEGETYHLIKVEKLQRCSPILWYTIDYDELERIYPLVHEASIQMKRKLLHGSSMLLSREKRILAQYPELANELPKEQDAELPDGQSDPPKYQNEHRDGQSDLARYQNEHHPPEPPKNLGKSRVSEVGGQNDHGTSQNDHIAKSNYPPLENQGKDKLTSPVVKKSMHKKNIDGVQNVHGQGNKMYFPTIIQETNTQETTQESSSAGTPATTSEREGKKLPSLSPQPQAKEKKDSFSVEAIEVMERYDQIAPQGTSNKDYCTLLAEITDAYGKDTVLEAIQRTANKEDTRKHNVHYIKAVAKALAEEGWHGAPARKKELSDVQQRYEETLRQWQDDFMAAYHAKEREALARAGLH